MSIVYAFGANAQKLSALTAPIMQWNMFSERLNSLFRLPRFFCGVTAGLPK